MARVVEPPVTASKGRAKRRKAKRHGPLRRVSRWLVRGVLAVAVLMVLAVLLYRFVNPPTTPYIFAEGRRLGGVEMKWVSADAIAPVMLRSVVAAEDANFCNHWGFDLGAIRNAISGGGTRGASTISQQVVKNAWLWQGRSWTRKALEAAMTPVMETLWPKRRILEVYLNVAEFGEGVFGIHAAAQAAFGVTPDKLTADQAARLAAVLPNPKERSAARPTPFLRKRAAAIRDGAATIAEDGRAACFGG
jgi:monofunctional biosynthetic peptidoglycan transglycosylase